MEASLLCSGFWMAVVRLPNSHSYSAARIALAAPWLIAAGVAILAVLPWWPDAPVVTAVALIALGATDAAIARYKSTPLLLSIVILQTTIYATIYGLFIGATLHKSISLTATSLHWGLDLLLSTVPMAIALQHVAICLRKSLSSQQ